MLVFYLSLTLVPRVYILNTDVELKYGKIIMNTEENKQLLQRIYAEISRGNPQLLLDSMADDIQWTIIGSTALPGTSRGKREVVTKPSKPIPTRHAACPIRLRPDPL